MASVHSRWGSGLVLLIVCAAALYALWSPPTASAVRLTVKNNAGRIVGRVIGNADNPGGRKVMTSSGRVAARFAVENTDLEGWMGYVKMGSRRVAFVTPLGDLYSARSNGAIGSKRGLAILNASSTKWVLKKRVNGVWRRRGSMEAYAPPLETFAALGALRALLW